MASAGALLAVEGNYEPNNWGITYQDETGGENKSWVSIVIELAVSGAPSAATLKEHLDEIHAVGAMGGVVWFRNP